MNETAEARRSRLNRERVARWRAKQSEEVLERIKRQDAERHAKRIANESEEEAKARRARHAQHHQTLARRATQAARRNANKKEFPFIEHVLSDTEPPNDSITIELEAPASPPHPHELVDVVMHTDNGDDDSQFASENTFLSGDDFRSVNNVIFEKMYAEQCRANQRTEEYRAKKLKLLEDQASLQRERLAYYPQIIDLLKTKLPATYKLNKFKLKSAIVSNFANLDKTC